jgi:Domain of unknown function (DUF4296)
MKTLMKTLLFLFWLFILQACTRNSTIPGDIIQPGNMETILWQLMQSDEYANTITIKDSSKNSGAERIKLYQQVFDLNKTSKAMFKKSYEYYLSHPDITKIMFDSIAARATRQKGDAYKQKPAAVK